MGSLKGETLAFREERETLTIQWKQGCLLGIGGDRSQTYVLCEYATRNEYIVPIYVQKGYEIKKNFTIDYRFQYGLQDDVMFFVYHDKSQKPYQQRFRCDGLQKFVYATNEVLKLAGVDFSWIAGDYLKDVWNGLFIKLCAGNYLKDVWNGLFVKLCAGNYLKDVWNGFSYKLCVWHYPNAVRHELSNKLCAGNYLKDVWNGLFVKLCAGNYLKDVWNGFSYKLCAWYYPNAVRHGLSNKLCAGNYLKDVWNGLFNRLCGENYLKMCDMGSPICCMYTCMWTRLTPENWNLKSENRTFSCDVKADNLVYRNITQWRLTRKPLVTSVSRLI